MPNDKLTILGGGQSAANAIKSIRTIDTESRITLVSEEPWLPYERPPLSKKCITGEQAFDSCTFFPEEFYQERNIELRLGCHIESVDFSARRLEGKNEDSISFDKLLIATGGRNRTLRIDGLESSAILQLRKREDSQKIIARSKTSNRILVIGGGFIGLEVAASLTSLGKEVTVVEAGDQLMGRAIPQEIATIIQSKHEAMGVEILLGTTVQTGVTRAGAHDITTSDGRALTFDLIIAGIGIEPNVSVFEPGSIDIDNGIVVDEYGKTSVQDVYAAGDVASFWHPLYQTYIRLESFRHAQNHGANAGKNMVGDSKIYQDAPWMWSDQYDLNIQLTGLAQGYDTCVRRGTSLEDGIVHVYLQSGFVKGACGVACGPKIGRDIRVIGMLSTAKKEVDPALLGDPKFKLQELLKD